MLLTERIRFINKGNQDFLNRYTIMRTPIFILTSCIVSACLSIFFRLTVVVYLHYLNYIKKWFIFKHAHLVLMKEKKTPSPYFLCGSQRLIHVKYYDSQDDFSPQVTFWIQTFYHVVCKVACYVLTRTMLSNRLSYHALILSVV